MTKNSKPHDKVTSNDVKKALKTHRGALSEVSRRSGVLLSTVSKVLSGLGTSINIARHAVDVLTEISETGSFTKTEARPRKNSVRAALTRLRKRNGGK